MIFVVVLPKLIGKASLAYIGWPAVLFTWASEGFPRIFLKIILLFYFILIEVQSVYKDVGF